MLGKLRGGVLNDRLEDLKKGQLFRKAEGVSQGRERWE